MKPENYGNKRPKTSAKANPQRQRTIKLGNYRPVDAGNPTFGPQGTMTYGELAAFIAMLFWMDDGQPTSTPYDSFYPAVAAKNVQVTAIQQALAPGGGLPNNNKLFNEWQTLMGGGGQKPDPLVMQALNALHTDFQNLVTAIGSTWDGCATVGLDMLERIANLT